jgi:hypothetical protein
VPRVIVVPSAAIVALAQIVSPSAPPKMTLLPSPV